MRRALLLVLPLCLTALPAHAAPRVLVVSDPAVAPAGCVDRAESSTGDVAVHGRTVVASWTIGDDQATGLATSRDGGKSFRRSVLTGVNLCAGNGPIEYTVDPDLAVGADGAPWTSSSGGLTPPANPSAVVGPDDARVYVKVGGAPAVNVFAGRGVERGFLETDPRDPSRGYVLTEGVVRGTFRVGPRQQGVPLLLAPGGDLLLARTTDRGRTWRTSTLRTAAPGSQINALGLISTGSTLVAVSVAIDPSKPDTLPGVAQSQGTAAPGTISAQRSTDRGATWSATVELGRVGQSTLGDAAAGGGVLAFAAAQQDGALVVFTSRDAGATWTRSTAATGVYQPSVGVAVDDTGRVGVLSYDVDGDAVTPQVSVSRDGRTWAGPVPLGPAFSLEGHPGSGHVSPFGAYLGGAGYGRELLLAFTAGAKGHTEVRLARLR